MGMAAACVVAAVLAVAGPPGALAVVGGTPDTTHTFVGVVVQQQVQGGVTGTEVCTGFLISPTTFVTAAHCFPPGSTAYVNFAPQISKPTYDANGKPTDPGYIAGVVDDYPGFCPDCGPGGTLTGDVAVVTFASTDEQTSLGKAVLPTLGSDAAMVKGVPIDVIGYGVQQDSKKNGPLGVGQRNIAVTKANGVDANNVKLLADPGVCFGDSGGPNLIDGTNVVVALNSFNNGNPNCNGVSYSVRLDDPLIQAFLNGNHPAPTG